MMDETRKGLFLLQAVAMIGIGKGMVACYDLRFPEPFRFLTLQGAQIFPVLAMFSKITGRKLWGFLLRCTCH